MPNGIDEIANGLEVGPKPAIKQNEQQGKERYYYKVFQSTVCRRRNASLRSIIIVFAFAGCVRQIIPASSRKWITGASPGG